MKGLGITSGKVHIEMDCWLRGSVLQGTVASGCDEVRTHFELESDEDEAALAEVVRLAKAGCFAESLVKSAVHLESTVTVNGRRLDLPECRRLTARSLTSCVELSARSPAINRK